MTKWTEPKSKLPSRTRAGDSQTAEQLFRVFGMDLPQPPNIDEMYEHDVRGESIDQLFETNTNEITDHRELLDVMEQEFINHSASASTSVPASPSGQAQDDVSQTPAPSIEPSSEKPNDKAPSQS